MTRRAIILVGLGFGDEGKGSMIDFLARRPDVHTVIRHNGGGQAAHNVVDDFGRHHTFAQFCSGMFVPGVDSYLSRYMLVDPLGLLEEAEHLRALGAEEPFRRLFVDRGALVVTPFHALINQLREMSRGAGLPGSCGKGIGETMADSLVEGANMLFIGDLENPTIAARKLAYLQERKRAQIAEFAASLPDSPAVQRKLWMLSSPKAIEFCLERYRAFTAAATITGKRYLKAMLARPGTMLFEGAQGVLLDEWYGFHPHTTWSTPGSANAETLLRDGGFIGETTRLGILRPYFTRHGAGPLPTEDGDLARLLPDSHNGRNAWQHRFRLGWFDLVAARYALAINGGIDSLAFTNLDRFRALPEWRVAIAYRHRASAVAGLERFFALDAHDGACRATDIKHHRPPDLVRQEALTHSLAGFTPEYRSFPAAKTETGPLAVYLEFLSGSLGAPIAFVSEGPAARHKRRWSDGVASSIAPLRLAG